MALKFSRGDLEAADLQNFLHTYTVSPLRVQNGAKDEEGSVYLESIDDE